MRKDLPQVPKVPQDDREKAFEAWLDKDWPIWRDNIGTTIWHRKREAFRAGWAARPGGAPDPEPWVFRHTGERYAERFWEHPDWVPVLDSDWSYEPRSGAPVTENTELIGRLRADPGDRFEPDDDLLIEAADALERVEGMNEQLRVMNRALERQHSVDVDALEAKPPTTPTRKALTLTILRNTGPGGSELTEFNRYDEKTIEYITSESRHDEHREWTRCLALADAVLALFEPREAVMIEALEHALSNGPFDTVARVWLTSQVKVLRREMER